jgi:hypothetical protein
MTNREQLESRGFIKNSERRSYTYGPEIDGIYLVEFNLPNRNWWLFGLVQDIQIIGPCFESGYDLKFEEIDPIIDYINSFRDTLISVYEVLDSKTKEAVLKGIEQAENSLFGVAPDLDKDRHICEGIT